MSTKKEKPTIAALKERNGRIARITLSVLDLAKMLGRDLADKFDVTIRCFIDENGNISGPAYREIYGRDASGNPLTRTGTFTVNWDNPDVEAREDEVERVEIAATLSDAFAKALSDHYDIEWRSRFFSNKAGVQHRSYEELFGKPAEKKSGNSGKKKAAAASGDLPF